MNTELINTVKNRIDKLPTEIAEAVQIVLQINQMQKIVESNHLSKEQGDSFVLETIMAVLGMVPPQTYPISLEKNVGLEYNSVVKIAREVDEQIITPILRDIENNKSEQEITENQISTVAVPEIAPNNLPMVEEGEIAHEVQHVEEKIILNKELGIMNNDGIQPKAERPQVAAPDYRYPNDKDPYRELPK